MADPATRWGLGIVLVFNAGVPSFTLLLSMHLQGAEGWSSLQAGLDVTPYALGALTGSAIANRLGGRAGPWVLAASSLGLGLVSLAVPVSLGEHGLLWLYWLALSLGGAGFGLFTASAFNQVISRIRPEAATSVSGLLPTAQQLGGTLGVTLAGIAYAASAPNTTGSLWHGMAYEAATFTLAAACAIGLAHNRTPPRPATPDGDPRGRGLTVRVHDSPDVVGHGGPDALFRRQPHTGQRIDRGRLVFGEAVLSRRTGVAPPQEDAGTRGEHGFLRLHSPFRLRPGVGGQRNPLPQSAGPPHRTRTHQERDMIPMMLARIARLLDA